MTALEVMFFAPG